MKVKDLVKILVYLDQNAVIDMASDEEGNSYGDIDTAYAEGVFHDGSKVYTLYPSNNQQAEERYAE